jgi:hypothetical protein
MIIYLNPTPRRRGGTARPAIAGRGATIPEDQSGPAVLPLFCLAPHGVFRAVPLTRDAVSSYLAFSPLPALFSKNRRSFFCDTFRRREFSFAAPAYFTRHAAVWCSDFPLANPAEAGLTSDHLPSAPSLPQTSQKKRTADYANKTDARGPEMLPIILNISEIRVIHGYFFS